MHVAKTLLPANNSKQSRRQPRAKKAKSTRASKSGRGTGTVIPREKERGLTSRQELWTPLFPARTTRRLRYSTNFTLLSTSGVVSSYVFSANGLFDPDITGTGHQPMGFDQMMLSYNHYVVTGATISLVCKNVSTSSPTVNLYVAASPTPITVIDTIVEFGLVEMDTLDPTGAYGANKMIKTRCSIKKVQGVRDVVDVTDLQGTAISNPIEQTYFHAQVWNSAGVTATVNFDAVIEYTAIFTEPRVLSPSLLAKLKVLGLFDDVKEKPGV